MKEKQKDFNIVLNFGWGLLSLPVVAYILKLMLSIESWSFGAFVIWVLCGCAALLCFKQQTLHIKQYYNQELTEFMQNKKLRICCAVCLFIFPALFVPIWLWFLFKTIPNTKTQSNKLTIQALISSIVLFITNIWVGLVCAVIAGGCYWYIRNQKNKKDNDYMKKIFGFLGDALGEIIGGCICVGIIILAIDYYYNTNIFNIYTTRKVTFELLEDRWCNSFWGQSVCGVLVNPTSRTCDVWIDISLYDSDGVQIGNTFDMIDNLEPGGKWRFKAMVFEGYADSYKITGTQYRCY